MDHLAFHTHHISLTQSQTPCIRAGSVKEYSCPTKATTHISGVDWFASAARPSAGNPTVHAGTLEVQQQPRDDASPEQRPRQGPRDDASPEQRARQGPGPGRCDHDRRACSLDVCTEP